MSRFIARHQLTAFLSLSFLISWIIWLAMPSLSSGDHYTELVITCIGAFGPALAAILVSGVARPERSTAASPKRSRLFALVLLATNVIWLFSTDKFGPFNLGSPVLFALKQVLAALVALVISGPFSRTEGVRDLLRPLTTWRVRPIWYFVAVAAIPFLIAMAIFTAWWLGAPLPTQHLTVGDQPLHLLSSGLLLAYLQTALFQGPLNEEPGWRGFALPRLQKIHGPIIASILIGSIWGLWHAPLYLSGVYSGGLQAMIGRLFWTIPLAFLFTWVYNRTRGSLLLSVLLHTSVNLQGDISSLVLSALPG
jgi:membrane protease YdiL (CAAX protease family)